MILFGDVLWAWANVGFGANMFDGYVPVWYRGLSNFWALEYSILVQ